MRGGQLIVGFVILGLAACGGQDASESATDAAASDVVDAQRTEASDAADLVRVEVDAGDDGPVCGEPSGEAGVCAGYGASCGSSCPCCQAGLTCTVYGCIVFGPVP
jgi:hypothetical protein